MTWPKTWPVGIDHCSVCYCFHCNVSTYMYAAALPHYLDTNVRAEKRVTAINIALKTSNDSSNMAFVSVHYKDGAVPQRKGTL